MTDEQIIKALEIHFDGRDICTVICPYSQDYYCAELLAKDAINLINRQKAEVEWLRSKYELSEAEREANVKGFTDSLAAVKSEAIKEFVELITEDYPEMDYYLNNLVKEMTEDEGK